MLILPGWADVALRIRVAHAKDAEWLSGGHIIRCRDLIMNHLCVLHFAYFA